MKKPKPLTVWGVAMRIVGAKTDADAGKEFGIHRLTASKYRRTGYLPLKYTPPEFTREVSRITGMPEAVLRGEEDLLKWVAENCPEIKG